MDPPIDTSTGSNSVQHYRIFPRFLQYQGPVIQGQPTNPNTNMVNPCKSYNRIASFVNEERNNAIPWFAFNQILEECPKTIQHLETFFSNGITRTEWEDFCRTVKPHTKVTDLTRDEKQVAWEVIKALKEAHVVLEGLLRSRMEIADNEDRKYKRYPQTLVTVETAIEAEGWLEKMNTAGASQAG